MRSKENYGRAMRRGVEQFAVEPEPHIFTTLVENDEAIEKVAALITPRSTKRVGRRVLRVEVDQASRDAAMAKLRSSDGKMVCHHAYRLPGEEGTRYYLTDHLIIRVRAELDDPVELLKAHGLKMVKKCAGIQGTYCVEVTDKAGVNPLKVAHDLIRRPEIVYAEPNLVERFYLNSSLSESDMDKTWHLEAIKAPQAWAYTRGDRNVVVAIIDDGCDLSHPAFAGAEKYIHAMDFVDGDEQPWSNHPEAESGRHGTPCAGLAVAEENATGIIGVAPGCALMPVRMVAPERIEYETLNIRDMFEIVGSKADVISNSWSCVPCHSPIPQAVADVFNKIATEGGPQGQGAVICFAAGNYNAPIRDDDNREFKYKTRPDDTLTRIAQTKILNGYAAHPYVIAVGATTSNGVKARYSNWGKEISVCAPSDNYDPLSGQMLPDKELVTADAESCQVGPGVAAGAVVTGFGGTSGACPLVAGVAALVRSIQPRLPALQVKAIIEETADKVVAMPESSDDELARARFIAGHSAWYGHGRVNAQKAVEKALLLQ